MPLFIANSFVVWARIVRKNHFEWSHNCSFFLRRKKKHWGYLQYLTENMLYLEGITRDITKKKWKITHNVHFMHDKESTLLALWALDGIRFESSIRNALVSMKQALTVKNEVNWFFFVYPSLSLPFSPPLSYYGMNSHKYYYYISLFDVPFVHGNKIE